MKKNFIIFSIAFLIVTGCSVNDKTASITVINTTDKDAYNVKIGDHYIGFIGKGQTSIPIYFLNEQNDAIINVDGFDVSAFNSGKIDLKMNYFYILMMQKVSGKYIYGCTGIQSGKEY